MAQFLTNKVGSQSSLARHKNDVSVGLTACCEIVRNLDYAVSFYNQTIQALALQQEEVDNYLVAREIEKSDILQYLK